MTGLALLAEELGVNERTLRRAVNQGTVRASRPSPRSLDLPLAERRYLRRSWRLLSALRSALRTERNVRFALLFGSAAIGADTPGSDVDLLVVLDDPALDRVIDLSSKLTAVVGRRPDVVRLEDAEAEPAFLGAVLSDGRVLVDRDGAWPELSRRGAELGRREHERSRQRVGAALAGIDRCWPADDGRARASQGGPPALEAGDRPPSRGLPTAVRGPRDGDGRVRR